MKEPILKIVPDIRNSEEDTAISVSHFKAWIDKNNILKDVSIDFPKNKISCIIGPSGSGKSTLIRSINRINDEVSGFATQGQIYFEGSDILDAKIDTVRLRTSVGMVFQKPCVFPKSIGDNVLFGVQQQKKLTTYEKQQIIEDNLKAVSLWKEVSHRLDDKATSLSLGQQQRLCIARTLAVKPKVILLDEPTSSLDPVSSRAIEDMMLTLKEQYTIIFVTHNIQQAKRIADHLIFICDGKVIEQGSAAMLFSNPQDSQTAAYLCDEFCDC